MPKKPQGINRETGKIMEAHNFHAGPAHFERDLKHALEFYLMDSGRWRALDALAMVANATLHQHGKSGEPFDGIHPNTKVEIPWWIARAIFIAWMEWSDGERGRTPKIRLGQVFEVERSQRGKLSPYEESEREERDMRLALLVAAHAPTVEAGVAYAVSESGLKERTIWDAWRKYSDSAVKAITLLQNKRV